MNERILPAYPIFVKDPNFSLWSPTEKLNESNLQTWYGETKTLYGFLKTGGKTYCFLGSGEDFASCGVEKAVQTGLSVSAFATAYTFEAGGVRLSVHFVSPLPPDDLELLSLPVCYMEYELEGQGEVSLFVGRNVAYNDRPDNANRGVRGAKLPQEGYETAFLGLRRQMPLSVSADLVGADWGYWYVAGEKADLLDERELGAYLAAGGTDFRAAGEERYLCARSRENKGAILLGFDEGVAIDYFGDCRKGYYLENHTIFQALSHVHTHRAAINAQLADFETALRDQAAKFGPEYWNVLCAALRQSVAAHKLVRDKDGNVLFLSKECGSNGCIGTVDVSYPSMPLYLLYAPELVKGMMRPVLKFARMDVWTYDFAPHDVGTYPLCCGQVYGLDKRLEKQGDYETHLPVYLLPENARAFDDNYQMPVEECANLLIMFLACCRQDGDLEFFRENRDLAAKWVEYLVKFGLRPENQLCTDDFAGHLKNNVNLAIKATVAIGAYAALLDALGEENGYRAIAENYAGEIVAFGANFDHLPLTWDSDDSTYSLKYNLAFDKALKLDLFPAETLEREVDCCLEKAGRFGTPIDGRKDYVKSDWLMWMASLTEDTGKQRRLMALLDTFLRESPDRVPFSDWYADESGHFYHFRARSVQGGCFMPLL